MKALVYTMVFAFISITAFAQRGNCEQRMKKVKAEKVAYISQRINITPEEAQTFWPVYNEFDSKKEAIRKEVRETQQKLNNESETLSDSDKEAMIDNIIKLRADQSKVNVEYHEKFKKVLTTDKLIEFYRAERHFKKHLLREIKNGPKGDKPCCPKNSTK